MTTHDSTTPIALRKLRMRATAYVYAAHIAMTAMSYAVTQESYTLTPHAAMPSHTDTDVTPYDNRVTTARADSMTRMARFCGRTTTMSYEGGGYYDI